MTTTKYRYRGHIVDADQALDEDGCVRNGYSVMVPMTMQDARMPLRRSIAQRIVDGDGTIAGLHRPGFRVPTSRVSDARAALDRAYAERDFNDANAWRTGGREGAEGSACTVRNGEYSEYFGAPGHIV